MTEALDHYLDQRDEDYERQRETPYSQEWMMNPETEHKMLRNFWDGLTERIFDGYSIDEFMIGELGVECGLLTEEIYEPEGKHKGMNMGEAEPGELCYVNNLFDDGGG